MDVTDLTILVGDNDCGKSNILRALDLFFNYKKNPNETLNFSEDYNRFVRPPNRKAKEITIELTLELPGNYHKTNGQFIRWKQVWRKDGLFIAKSSYHGFNEEPGRNGKVRIQKVEIPAKSKVHTLLDRVEYEYIPAVRSDQFFRKLRGRIYGAIAETAGDRFRSKSSEFEKEISKNVSALLGDISSDLSETAELKLPNNLGEIFERLDFLTSKGSISLNNRGDGIKARYIPLILKFISERKMAQLGKGASPFTFIWAYEEPENNLEFRRAIELADTFERFAKDELTQVLLTTHSPVFYNLTSKKSELHSNWHVYKQDTDTGTSVLNNYDTGLSLDERMGAMGIIAPHIRAAQEELSIINEQMETLKVKVKEENVENLPAIFMEGKCEFLLYSELIDRCFPEMRKQVFLAEPPPRAGADYVTNMLRAWEYGVKRLPSKRRPRAFGMLDRDAAGEGALKRLHFDITKPKHFQVKLLDWPEHLHGIRDLGVKLPIALEELLPEECWVEAESAKYLIDRQDKGPVSPALAAKLLESEVPFAKLLDPTSAIFIKKAPCPDKKVKWIESIASLGKEEFSRATLEHRKLLGDAIKYLLDQ